MLYFVIFCSHSPLNIYRSSRWFPCVITAFLFQPHSILRLSCYKSVAPHSFQPIYAFHSKPEDPEIVVLTPLIVHYSLLIRRVVANLRYGSIHIYFYSIRGYQASIKIVHLESSISERIDYRARRAVICRDTINLRSSPSHRSLLPVASAAPLLNAMSTWAATVHVLRVRPPFFLTLLQIICCILPTRT